MRAAWCALAATLASGCSLLAPHFARPDLSVVGIQMLGGNLFQQSFRLTLQIHNPNDRALPVERVQARLRLAGEDFASGVTTRPFVVPARGDARFDMTIAANLAAGLVQLAKRVDAHSGTVDYALDGVVRLELPLFRSLPFHEVGELPLSVTAR